MTSSIPPECEQLLISGYVLGDLSPAEVVLFEEILAENPEVAQQVSELQQALELTFFPAEVAPLPPLLKRSCWLLPVHPALPSQQKQLSIF